MTDIWHPETFWKWIGMFFKIGPNYTVAFFTSILIILLVSLVLCVIAAPIVIIVLYSNGTLGFEQTMVAFVFVIAISMPSAISFKKNRD